jgi:hypothetical protein
VRRLRRSGFGFWLGVLAISLNGLLPIHFAVDIVHAAVHVHAAGLRHAAAAPAHHNRPAGVDHHHDGTCPICASGAAAVGTASLPTPVPLVLARPFAIKVVVADIREFHRDTILTPYAPRGPPIEA